MCCTNTELPVVFYCLQQQLTDEMTLLLAPSISIPARFTVARLLEGRTESCMHRFKTCRQCNRAARYALYHFEKKNRSDGGQEKKPYAYDRFALIYTGFYCFYGVFVFINYSCSSTISRL